MDPVDRLWQRIEVVWQRQPCATILRPGASKHAIEEAERTLDVIFPEDVRVSCRRHDGGYSVKLVSTMDVLPVEDMVEWWQVLEELRQDEEWERQQPYYFTENVLSSGWKTGPIQPVWWHPRWIPFAYDPTGNIACIDLAPAVGGAMGQILDWDHECGPSRVLFPSFERLRAALAEQVASGH
ncbi:MAG TPA: SMI1/KNR4 family protein [Ktedonobacterales bacterium]|nr:SMI1/KNR4 family protein [Ktedonobacterales bacterium]